MARKTRQRKTYRRKLHLGGDQENQSEGFGTELPYLQPSY
jgi:hypothetical protein